MKKDYREIFSKYGYEIDNSAYPLGEWIKTQIQTYRGRNNCTITYEKVKLLEEIHIKWFDDDINNKLQGEVINDINKKKKEVINRLYSLLIVLEYKQNINFNYKKDIEDINEQFIKQLTNI